MTRAALFDLDDTLLDRDASIEPFVKGLYLKYTLGQPPYATYRDRFRELDRHGYSDKHALFQTLIEEFAIPASVEDLVADFKRNAWITCKTFPDAEGVLKQLRSRGYKLGIITNGSVESQRAKLVATGLAALVDVVLISAEEGINKPAPEIFVRAAGRLGVSIAECFFVGDNPQADIAGARNAGMKAVWCRRHLPWPDELPIVPDYAVSDLVELLSIRF